MTNTNEELLSWAVENIKEWNDDYTHLRSDNLENPFYSTGCWSNYKDLHWIDPTDGENEYVPLRNNIFSTEAPQVISKEGWLHAKIRIACGTVLATPSTSSSEAQQGHVHAELMAEYALVAKTNPMPWREFEWYNNLTRSWHMMTQLDVFNSCTKYRRKPIPPKTMNIGGIVVEAWPLDHMPSVGFEYYSVVVGYYNDLFDVGYFTNRVSSYDAALLYAGKVFSTKEQAQAVADALNLVYNRALGRGEG